MRRGLAFILAFVLFVPWTASHGRQGNDGYRLRLECSSDGHGNSVFALEINEKTPGRCDVQGTPVANYLFVNRKTGKRRWLFPEPQDCIWRVFYFADRPRTAPVEPAAARAVVYDITPSGDLNNWGHPRGFRFCTGTNPCLPLRRIFVSRADGRDLTPLTPTFQIFDRANGLASITQRKDGVIVVSHQGPPVAEFSIDTFGAR
jgi:hypothetical protein